MDIGSDLVDPTHVHHKYAVNYERDGLVVSFQYYCSLIKYRFRALNGEIRVSSWPFLFAIPVDVARTAFDRAYKGRYRVSPAQAEFDQFISDIANALRHFGSQPLEHVIHDEGKKLEPRVFGYIEGNIAAGSPGDLIRHQDQNALEVLTEIERTEY
jgi:hypothetical protein